MYSKSTYTILENYTWDMHFLLYQHQRRTSYKEVKNEQKIDTTQLIGVKSKLLW